MLRLFVVAVFLPCYVVSQCNVMNCPNYEHLPTENVLGVIDPQKVGFFCGVLPQLNMCIEKETCTVGQQLSFAPFLNPSNFICQNLEAYTQAIGCFFSSDTEDSVDVCGDELAMDCKSFDEYSYCITKEVSMSPNCNDEAITLLSGILRENIKPYQRKYNCTIPGENTTTQNPAMTTEKSTASVDNTDIQTSSTNQEIDGESGDDDDLDRMSRGDRSPASKLLMNSVYLILLVLVCYL